MNKHSLVRTIYLYLFSLLGLVLLTIGAVGFVNMGLKTFVFTKAEQDQRFDYRMPMPPIEKSVIVKSVETGEKLEVSSEIQTNLEAWLVNYENWEEENKSVDYITSRRHTDAARNLALILIGLPLYLFHWFIIKRDAVGKA